MLTWSCFGNKEEEAESWSTRNGRRLLEESISLFDGKVNPIRCFSAREIEIATNNFDERQLFHRSKHHCLYRGFLRGQPVTMKRYQRKILELTIRDIVVASRLSVHKNVLKLIFEQFDLTLGYVDPENMLEDRLNEKADIYGFGVLLRNLVSGRSDKGPYAFGFGHPCSTLDESPVDRSLYARHYVENGRFQEFVDPRLSADEPWEYERQFKDSIMLAIECTRFRGVDRPNMTEVGMKLAGMYRSAFSNT